jgi:hypothetical protein
MSSELIKPTPNPWEAYGDAMATRTIVGKLLKFSKGDYVAGTSDEDVAVGTRFAAVMDSLHVGWIRWQNNRPTEQRMGPISENFQPPRRTELGDLDESQWETDDDGHPRDPWQFSNYLVLVAVDDDELFTFTTASRGGLNAIGELCKTFGKTMRQQPDKYPVIELGVGSYQHSNRAYGRIKYPVLAVVDWIEKKRFLDLLDGEGEDSSPAALPAEAAKATPKKTAKATAETRF